MLRLVGSFPFSFHVQGRGIFVWLIVIITVVISGLIVSASQWAYVILGDTFVPQGQRGRGDGRALTGRLCTDAWTKKDEKGYFFSSWAVRSAAIV